MRARSVTRIVAIVLLALLGAAAAHARDERPRNLILLISDGCGSASFDLARAVAGHALALDAVRTGAVRTRSIDDSVTDSAAGATAYATGERTINHRIARDSTGAPLTSWFLQAAVHGRAAGIVVTTDITDATPAAFFAQVHERSSQDSVAAALVAFRPLVALGGGRAWFLPRGDVGRRGDGRDLLDEARRLGVRPFSAPSALAAPDAAPWLGLFAPHALAYRIDRDTTLEPDLGTMARAALRRLVPARHGFVLMVEGSRIDHAAHQNDPATHAREVLEYDAMAAGMLDFARHDRHTLVISVSDHETGGLQFAAPGGDAGLDVAPLRSQRASSAQLAAWIGRTGTLDSVFAARWDGGALTPAEHDALAAAGDSLRARLVAAVASRRAHVRWRTTGHTGQDVPLFAFGPGADQLRGTLDNAEVGRRIARLLGVQAGAVSRGR
jgi:alkaline phosphatase